MQQYVNCLERFDAQKQFQFYFPHNNFAEAIQRYATRRGAPVVPNTSKVQLRSDKIIYAGRNSNLLKLNAFHAAIAILPPADQDPRTPHNAAANEADPSQPPPLGDRRQPVPCIIELPDQSFSDNLRSEPHERGQDEHG